MTTETAARTIRLQSVGWVPAVPADSLRVGDGVMWNFGGTTTVTDIRPRSTHSLEITFRDTKDGYFTRVKRRTALLAGRRDGEWIGQSPTGGTR